MGLTSKKNTKNFSFKNQTFPLSDFSVGEGNGASDRDDPTRDSFGVEGVDFSTSNLVGLIKTPCLSFVVKYRFPATEPSFLPKFCGFSQRKLSILKLSTFTAVAR